MKSHLWVLAVLGVACEGGSGGDPLGLGRLVSEPVPADPFHPAEPGVQSEPLLRAFGGATACSALEQEIEDRASLEMHLQVSQSRRWALESWDWYHTHQSWTSSTSDAGSAGAGGGTGGAGGGSASASGPGAYTTTNTQVAGVDEADFVKNDGTRLFVLSGRTLFAVSSWPANALARRGALQIAGKPTEMFLADDRLVVFSTRYDAAFGPLPTWCVGGSSIPAQCEDWYPNATQVTWVDVSDLSNLRVIGAQVFPGRYETARRVGTTMRLVLQDGLSWSGVATTWIPWDQAMAMTKAQLARAYDRLAFDNELQIRARTLQDWLPDSRLVSTTGAAQVALDCTQVSVPTASAELGLVSVVSLDVTDATRVSRKVVLARVDEVYANASALYLAHRHWWWGTANQQTLTYVYKLDTSRPDSVDYVAAGVVEGTIVNQFSMDEANGVLRLAVTVQAPGSWTATGNHVLTLAPQAGRLVEVGRSPNIGAGERIMSARFVGDTAYVVTFRQTDPLFTIDLADPANPRLLGELVIPGFSSYIHPLDADHLLTIGTYVPAQPSTWSERALQLSIFDVSDRAHPRQTFTHLVGTGASWSEAQWEHKAFNYFPERGLLAIPFFDWQYTYGSGASWWASYVSDLRVFRVDSTRGFTSLGAIDMRDVLQRSSSSPWECWYWYWQPMVRRSVMADDFVYAISSGGVRVANVADLSQPVATVPFSASP